MSTVFGPWSRRACCTVLLCCALWSGARPAAADPAGDDDLSVLLLKVEELHRTAEAAEQSWLQQNAEAAARDRELSAVLGELRDQELRVDEAEAMAARLAAEQYSHSRVTGFLRVLFSDHPGQALDNASKDRTRARTVSEVVGEVRAARSRASELKDSAQLTADRADQARQAAQQARDLAVERERAAQAELAALTEGQLAELDRREAVSSDLRQQELVASGRLSATDRTPSPAARAAVSFALAQLGRPYLWGGEGPDAFDCSGLTSRAWAAAGTAIPRTSEEQWARLPRVPLAELVPGDLVIYFAGASHVAMYVGHGLMVHAPHTGSTVRVAPVGALPLLGAVRPPGPVS
ncbi:NlpC/P60 family protein [Kitasatospora sp. CMC57]|uniref:NlpC/P60 family protein n=1 Tax=Kitasatospora sp. CMC57 TaxID=3231513 RepID=A0AB33JPS3_9ACTN